ncbi:hypothetical protein [Flavobacterium piscis]|uniref:Uncharacterized protein n=1 Tax=Flavobacterium piscis TaxID=1114874 RepID=A0ABU1YA23_9FLAO|nr:hypothetical protein [Flavobacterium piscis]MDR7211082.1 hypothetical protein [Flavobacterium piscis]
MNNQFNIIFSVQVFHEYFEKGICNCLVFQPNRNTTNLINRYGFKINQNENGFHFYSNTPKDITTYLTYIETNSQQNFFEFDITTTDSNFTVFTELPTNWIGQFVYTSSNVLKENEKLALKTDYSSSANSVIIGSLKIYFRDLIGLINKITECNYAITFESRATQWRYYIINKSDVSLNNPEIISKNPIAFEQAITVTVQNGRKALLFSSGENFMKMSKVAKYKFDLVDKSNTTNQTRKIIFKGLPNPGPNNIGLEEENKEKIVTSSMYVYI